MDIAITCNSPDGVLFSNAAENSRLPLKWVKELAAHDGHAVIVGGGPSVADCLDSIRWRKSLGQKIFALNGAARFLADAGITPDFQVIVDAREHNAAFILDDDEITYARTVYLASQCDPLCFQHAGDAAVLWHPVIEGLLDVVADDGREFAMIGGGTTVGLSAMALAHTLGYRKLHLYGYDSSHRDDDGHAYAQPANDREPVVSVTAYGRTFRSSLAMAYQAELFGELANALIADGSIITMDGDGLLPHAFRHMWAAPIAMSEQEKYAAMWDFPQYRDMAPGEHVAEYFTTLSKIGPLDTVVDFGCGTGRGARRVHELTGCRFVLVDFTTNSLDSAVAADASWYMRVQHDLSQPFPADSPAREGEYGFCTDVMEHIPPEQVDAVINNIMAVGRRVFFQISLVDDQCGVLIGHPLHLSVHDADWWFQTFRRLGHAVDYFAADDSNATMYVTASNSLTT